MKKLFIVSLVSLFTLSSFAQSNSTVKQKRMVSEPQIVKMRAELFQSKFNLSVEQTKKVEIVMNSRNASLKKVRETVRENQALFNTDAMPIRKQFQDELKSIMTAEQYETYAKDRVQNSRRSVDNLEDDSEFDLRKE